MQLPRVRPAGGFARRAFWHPRPPLAAALIALLLAGPLLALDPDRPPESYSIRGWFTEQGLPSNKIRAVLQARDGYLWLATAQGISRFDGNRFTTFNGSTHPELRGGGFYAILEDSAGTLWFGGDAGVFRRHGEGFDHFTTADGLADNRVRALALDRHGGVVACTHSGVSFLRDGRWETPPDWADLTGEARAYLDRADGSTLVATEDGVWRFRGPVKERLTADSGTSGRPFTSLAETRDGRLCIGTSRGVRCLSPDGTLADIAPSDGSASARVAALRVDRDGNLWVGTYGAGLFRLSHGRLEAAPYRDTFGRAVIQQFCEDQEGSLWIAAAAGLFRLGNTLCRSIDAADGLAQTAAYSVIESRQGHWWIGLWGGGVYRCDGNRAERLALPSGLGVNQVSALAEDPAGTLWIGGPTGLFRYVSPGVENLYVRDQAPGWRQQLAADPSAPLPGLAHPAVNAIAIDPAGTIWAATDGALYHGTPGRWQAETRVPGLAGNAFRHVLVTRRGDVWVTVPPDGVARLHDGRWTAYLCGGPISRIYPRALLEDSTGAIWVTTDGGGLNRFQDNRWRTFTTADGLLDDFVSGLAEDASRHLWLASPRGVMRLALDQFDNVARHGGLLEPRIFNRDDGLPAAEVNHQGSPNTTRTRDGRILVATDRGITVIEPDRLRPNRLPPPVYLERFLIDGLPADLRGPILVPPGRREIQIDYTALSLLAPEKVRFRLRLEPLDPTWVDAGSRRDVRYAHVAPGDYRFHVIACNNDGLWNETGATLAFTVRPYFYQTPWFLGLTTLAGGGGLLVLARARAHLARQRLAKLETLVGERTQELRLAKEAAEAAQASADRERARVKFIFDALPIGITWMIRGQPETRLSNPAHRRITGVSAIEPTTARAATHPDDRLRQDELHHRLRAGEIDHYELEKRYVHADGSIRWVAESCRVLAGASGEIQEILTTVDISARRAAEAEREALHRQLLETSRQAGMAEIATSVLHNVGNVLTSVNVSATLLGDEIRQSRVPVIARLATLLQEHAADLGHFLTEDPRGRTVPEFLGTLAEHLAREHAGIVAEVALLQKNVDHIKHIVAMQQNYARVSGLAEVVELVDLVEDAVRLNAAALERHGTTVQREFAARPRLIAEKHKILQILVNLVRNADYACVEAGRTDPAIAVRVTADATHARLAVIDNGIGIPPENLTRIFAHGFTTRKDGHGFGLHSGALAAGELGGELTAHSDGPGCGATFTLVLPLQPPRRAP